MKDIQLVHIEEDYCRYSYLDEYGNKHEVEVTGTEQRLINTLGLALKKESFESKLMKQP